MRHQVTGAEKPAARNFNYRDYLPKAILSMTQCTPYPEYDGCLGERQQGRSRNEAITVVPDQRLRLLGLGC